MTLPFGALRATCALLTLCGLVYSPANAAGQSVLDAVEADSPAHIAFVEGSVVLERDGRTDTSPANMPLLAGDRVRTQAGRVEILFADGSTLHLDGNTTVDFQSDELVRLLDGRVRLAIAGPDRDVSYRVDAPSAWVQIAERGEYRVAILRGDREPEVELAVIRGAAELVNEGGRTALRAGERAFSRASAAPSHAYAFNSASWDAFDRWSEARRDERLGVSAQYLPDQVRPYSASFDRYGSWRHESSYGYVWYPTVSDGWRPYYRGRWATLRPYGWTWIGSDPWAWPTHHYGRWGFSAGLWFWIPGRSWAPAWVSWAYAPGYVSWCPLGWNNRAVLQFGGVYGRGYDPWRAWTVVPRRHFGVDFVHVRGVHGGRFDARTRQSFVAQNRAPESRGYAVPRASAPIRVAGTRSGSRGRSPVYTNLEPGASRVGAAPSRSIIGPSRNSVTDSPRASATDGRARAVPRGGTTEFRVPAARADSRGVSSGRTRAVPRDGTTEFRVPAANADSGGVSTGRSRAVPRDGTTEFRVPAATADSGGVSTGRSRAVPRGGTTEFGVPPSSDSRARSPYVVQTPSPMPRSDERYAPTDRGPRAVPREDRVYRGSASSPQRQPDPAIQRNDAPAGWRAAPRAGDGPAGYRRDSYQPRPSEPDRGASRAVPRSAPESSRPSAPEYRQSPPSRSGGEAVHGGPPPSSSRPSGGASRPRSGGESSGTARPRGGGRR
jgi:hypothetical protein